MTRSEAKRLLETRKVKQARAEGRYHDAQEAYEEAAAKHLPSRHKLRRAMYNARRWVYKRRRWTDEARKAFYQHPSRNKLKPERTLISDGGSPRYGVKPRRIVLHITVSHNRPGLSDIDAILGYFKPASTQANSTIVNDAEGHDARCVKDSVAPWTQAAYNRDSLSIEQIEYADKPREEWFRDNKKQLDNTAAWCAHWSHLYDIPLVETDTGSGVCQHSDLGTAGGGHSDCGSGYPIDYVIKKAQEIKKAKYG